MAEEVKRISIKEFRSLGFIQEINRRFLHPCGMALEVLLNEETGEEVLGGVWDYRDDPEGMLFADGMISADKAASVDKLFASKVAYRKENFGYTIQPVADKE